MSCAVLVPEPNRFLDLWDFYTFLKKCWRITLLTPAAGIKIAEEPSRWNLYELEKIVTRHHPGIFNKTAPLAVDSCGSTLWRSQVNNAKFCSAVAPLLSELQKCSVQRHTDSHLLTPRSMTQNSHALQVFRRLPFSLSTSKQK